ncbi:MBL fold metallo-hydrolase [Sinanaerobacter chloroacetimidivorans]|uniref:MBL fold metallo-hydrolase n=1 Tax=Sinanaerobacter chloroacetimidivorans TaxID=2818044 RepID=A0A8J7W3K2_9FIRM|nr:MBL fold metallo-hydrolase [Sinanaerobacter chloroacetimidivorans]MBR0600242.1 MBL fold metallo-hydrolase [Sinanaerobacter chloroacetimidivorans]
MMKIKRLIGGNLESNGYIIFHEKGGACYIIDPGYQGEKFLETVKDLDLSIKGILLTHHHYDHVGGVEKIKAETGCPLYLHRADCDEYKRPVEVMLEHGDTIMLDQEEIKVIHTPGHTMGSVCYYSEESKLAFTGDTIFNVDLGRTDLSDGSPAEMENTIRNIIDKWSNDIHIYPGHGDSCNMKYVRKYNQEFLDIVE